MIVGIGADIVEVPRMQRLLERFGERLARRILAPSEWEAYQKAARRELFLASRFAAKEAFSKALGTGLRFPVAMSNIGVHNDALGKPSIRLQPGLQALTRDQGVTDCHLTLTHERSLACAVVVLENRGR